MTAKEYPARETDQASLPLIVVVATDATILKMLEIVLQAQYECHLLSFSTSRSALEAMSDTQPNLVIVHFQLLGQNALDFTNHLHNIQGSGRVPIILIDTPSSVERICFEPHLICLGSPFSLEELYRTVNTYLTP